MPTKYASQEVWNLRDSLRRARARAVRYYQSKRELETKARDLERSRDSWRMKFEQATRAASQPAASPPLPQDRIG